MSERLADIVSLDSVSYQRTRKIHTDKAVVTLSQSTNSLWFNPKMVKLLDMKDWKQVLVGFDKKSNIIILKRVDAEEYGATPVRNPFSAKDVNPDTIKRTAECRKIGIAHVIKGQDISTGKAYRAERDGVMIFLRDIKEDE